jgi:5,10-methylenetetrahydrofolate reductase, prokaryotic form
MRLSTTACRRRSVYEGKITMKIRDILKSEEPHISFEVFPPKTDAGYDSVLSATRKIAALKPSFISVTYGAGGGTSKNTVSIATQIEKDFGVTSLAHLTCVSSTKEEVHRVIDQLKENQIENILALRGDIPSESESPLPSHYRYASELIEDIRKQGEFCIGAACYPEGHVETEHKKDDIRNLKHKVDCGVDFLTTQMFFDNNILYNFLYRIREKGITVPVLPGIMPVTNKKQIARIGGLSGTILPERFRAIVDRFGDDPGAMQQAGIAYATDQIIDLIANGVNHIHVYSMNKPEVAEAIMRNLSEIVA